MCNENPGAGPPEKGRELYISVRHRIYIFVLLSDK